MMSTIDLAGDRQTCCPHVGSSKHTGQQTLEHTAPGDQYTCGCCMRGGVTWRGRGRRGSPDRRCGRCRCPRPGCGTCCRWPAAAWAPPTCCRCPACTGNPAGLVGVFRPQPSAKHVAAALPAQAISCPDEATGTTHQPRPQHACSRIAHQLAPSAYVPRLRCGFRLQHSYFPTPLET